MEPGMILNAIKTAGSGVWKLWNLYLGQKEIRELLRSALARAICKDRHRDAEVVKLAHSLEQQLRQTEAPSEDRGRLDRLKRFGRRLVPWRARPIEEPAAQVFGHSFGEHLQGWLREAISSPEELEQQLRAVDCPGGDPTVAALVKRFPAGFEIELLREDDDIPASDARERLAKEILTASILQRERETTRTAAERVFADTAQAAVPGAAAFGLAELAGSGEPTAIATGLGVAALSALASRITDDRACAIAAEHAAIRGMALSWLAELLGRLSGTRPSPRPDRLNTALMSALRAELAGRLRWPESLKAELSSLEHVGQLARDGDDELLSQAVKEVDRALSEADRSAAGRGPALASVVDLFNVCAGAAEQPV